jgi:hypothetical protein
MIARAAVLASLVVSGVAHPDAAKAAKLLREGQTRYWPCFSVNRGVSDALDIPTPILIKGSPKEPP